MNKKTLVPVALSLPIALLLLVLGTMIVEGVNIKSAPWKASGNGIDDAWPAIQSTVNAVAASGGGPVSCPGGNYSLSHSITWTAPDVYFIGDGACKLILRSNFVGAAAIVIGQASAQLAPTYRGGVANVTVDMTQTTNPALAGVELVQTWFTRVSLLRIVNPNGLPVPRQTAFIMSAGELPNGKPATNWSGNNSIYDLQISGSFAIAIQHITGCALANAATCWGGMVNGTNYFGGSAYGTPGVPGTYGFRIEAGAGDSTRMYGTAFEDFDTCVYVASPNNPKPDVRTEGCRVPFATAPGITFSDPGVQGNLSPVAAPLLTAPAPLPL